MNLPIRNQHLIEAIQRLREEMTLESEDLLFEAIKEAHFITPVVFEEEPMKDSHGNYVIDEQTKVNFSILRNNQEDIYLPVFTDYQQFEEWFHAMKKPFPIVTTWKMYTTLILKNNEEVKGLVINPRNENMIITRNALQRLKEDDLDDASVDYVEENQDGKIKEALITLFKRSSFVKKAYLQNTGHGYNIIVEFSNIKEDLLFKRIQRVVEPLLHGKPYVLLNYYGPQALLLAKQSELFYKK